jgi:Icc-related predicted phosphoesterase
MRRKQSEVVKVLAVSDKVMDAVYSPAISENFGDIDLVIACGDLPFYYLEFIASSLSVPCFFVYGNHDLNVKQTVNGLAEVHPPGWVNLDGQTLAANGLLLAGLEGSIRYRPDGLHQYSQDEMRWKALKMLPGLLANRLRYDRYLDILVAHSPPYGIHDGPDHVHTGFKVFLTLIERFRPRYLLHGHKHVYPPERTLTNHHQTEVINVYPYRVIETDIGKGRD